MSWKPIKSQLVMANLDGRVRQVRATEWNPETGAVKVAWPPQNPRKASHTRFSMVKMTQLDEAWYQPLHPDAFTSATRG